MHTEHVQQCLSIGWVLDEVDALLHFVEICQQGLGQAVQASGWVEANHELSKLLCEPGMDELRRKLPHVQPLTEERLPEAKRKAKVLERFAQTEGSNYLYSIATVRLWSILESGIDELVLQMIKAVPQSRNGSVFEKLKAPIVPFITSTPEEQAMLLFDLLKRELASGLKIGVDRFETLLNCVGLGGAVPEPIARAVLEFGETRNVIVHKRGIADSRFLDRCPWLGAQAGEQLLVSAADFHIFHFAVIWYIVTVDWRVASRFRGRTPPADNEKGLARVLSLIAGLCQKRKPRGEPAA